MITSLPSGVASSGISQADELARHYILSNLLIGEDHAVRIVSKNDFHHNINHHFNTLRRERVIEDDRRQGQYRLVKLFYPAEYKPFNLNCFGIYLNSLEVNFCLDCYTLCCKMEPYCFGLVDIRVLCCFDIEHTPHFRLNPHFFNLYHWKIRDILKKHKKLELADHQIVLTGLIKRYMRSQENVEIDHFQRQMADEVINSGPRLYDVWVPGDYREAKATPAPDVYDRLIDFITAKQATLTSSPPEETKPIIKSKKTVLPTKLEEAAASPKPKVERVKLIQPEKMRYFLDLIESATGTMILYRNRRIRELDNEIISARTEKDEEKLNRLRIEKIDYEAENEAIKLFRRIARSANFNRLPSNINQDELIARLIYRSENIYSRISAI